MQEGFLAPVIDGKLDEKLWETITSNVIEEKSPRTLARLCFDEKNLYIAFECHKLQGRKAQGTPKDRDGDVWTDDAIEVCLSPPQAGKLHIWYHFIISVANSVCDQRNRFSRSYGESYNPEFKHAVHRKEDSWTVEVAIPLSALEIPGWSGRMGVLQFQVNYPASCRENDV